MWAEKVKVVAKTAMAILVEYEGVGGWVPFSIIKSDSEIYEKSDIDDEGVLVISEAFAEKKGWMI